MLWCSLVYFKQSYQTYSICPHVFIMYQIKPQIYCVKFVFRSLWWQNKHLIYFFLPLLSSFTHPSSMSLSFSFGLLSNIKHKEFEQLLVLVLNFFNAICANVTSMFSRICYHFGCVLLGCTISFFTTSSDVYSLKDVVWHSFSSFVSNRPNIIDSRICLGLIKIVIKPPKFLHYFDANHQKSSIIAHVPTLVDLSPKVLQKHDFLFLITSFLPTFTIFHTFFLFFLSHIYMLFHNLFLALTFFFLLVFIGHSNWLSSFMFVQFWKHGGGWWRKTIGHLLPLLLFQW